MKNYFKISAVVIFTAISTFIVSCAKDDDPVVVTTPPDNTITAKAIATADLSILVAALTKTNLAADLKGAGPFTVFAPTNAAFTAAGISVATINNSTPAEVTALTQVLLNHVVSGSTTAAQLMDNSYLRTLGLGAASTTNKLSMLVKKTTTAAGIVVKLNGNATVTMADISASNGVIHLVDKVIFAPTIIDLAATNSNFSSLATSLTTANLITTLQGAGPFTVFAPDNNAFTSLATELAPAVPTTAQLINVLKYHIVSGNYLASDLPTVIAAGPTTTLNPQTFTISLTGGANITGTKLPLRTASKIVTTDLQGKNGVIHVIDKVLLPATF
jgi:uncharacterized surface protein with fasciclin (FAS1) repeats